MAIQPLTSILRVQRANVSQYRLQKTQLPGTVMTMRAEIPDELKAYGSIPDRFTVQMTSEGPKVDITL